MKTYIKFNYLIGTQALQFQPKRLSCVAAIGASQVVAGSSNFFIIKKYYHNHPVSKLEKILKKMNEKKLILPSPRENIDSIFKANKLSKIEIDNLLKIKRAAARVTEPFGGAPAATQARRRLNNLPAPAGYRPAESLPPGRGSRAVAAAAGRLGVKSIKAGELSLQAKLSGNQSRLPQSAASVACRLASRIEKKNNLLKNLLYYNSSLQTSRPLRLSTLRLPAAGLPPAGGDAKRLQPQETPSTRKRAPALKNKIKKIIIFSNNYE